MIRGRLPPFDAEALPIQNWLMMASLRKLTEQPFVTPIDVP